MRARLAADAEPQLYVGGAANTVDVLGYLSFLSRCAADDRFTADHLIPAMAAKVRMTWLDKVTYRFVLIPFVRKRLLEQGEALAWAKRRPAWGPGRIDPFNPVKFGMLHLADDETIGNSDMQAVWNLDARERIRPHGPLHWDGLNNSVREVVISSALGDGTVAREFSMPAMERIERFLRALPPPPSPHQPDPATVERGKVVFAANCAASCSRRSAHPQRYPARRGWHRHQPVAHVDRARPRYLQQFPRGPQLGFQVVPQKLGLCRRAARWPMAQRALSSQRLGSDLARPSRAAAAEAGRVRSRPRCAGCT